MGFLSSDKDADNVDHFGKNPSEMMVPADLPASQSAMSAEIRRLTDSIMALHESPGHIGFFTAVDKDTGKARLVPIPTAQNLVKLNEYYEELPKRVRNTIQKNMASEDYASFESIMRALNVPAPKALEGKSLKEEEEVGNGE